ncbi:uncharacterized protein LTR77_007315 [Saxophila tyrrhenica]|uniref:Uncharacterized protein n=1 Tax=Saxophila tyrrhenica TaxID=1690608 RepID=A0AAV9P6B1_9PEZI|nr:hypothetical protein LTR77_007315 [Saxophila tyrrhenica]
MNARLLQGTDRDHVSPLVAIPMARCSGSGFVRRGSVVVGLGGHVWRTSGGKMVRCQAFHLPYPPDTTPVILSTSSTTMPVIMATRKTSDDLQGHPGFKEYHAGNKSAFKRTWTARRAIAKAAAEEAEADKVAEIERAINAFRDHEMHEAAARAKEGGASVGAQQGDAASQGPGVAATDEETRGGISSAATKEKSNGRSKPSKQTRTRPAVGNRNKPSSLSTLFDRLEAHEARLFSDITVGIRPHLSLRAGVLVCGLLFVVDQFPAFAVLGHIAKWVFSFDWVKSELFPASAFVAFTVLYLALLVCMCTPPAHTTTTDEKFRALERRNEQLAPLAQKNATLTRQNEGQALRLATSNQKIEALESRIATLALETIAKNRKISTLNFENKKQEDLLADKHGSVNVFWRGMIDNTQSRHEKQLADLEAEKRRVHNGMQLYNEFLKEQFDKADTEARRLRLEIREKAQTLNNFSHNLGEWQKYGTAKNVKLQKSEVQVEHLRHELAAMEKKNALSAKITEREMAKSKALQKQNIEVLQDLHRLKEYYRDLYDEKGEEAEETFSEQWEVQEAAPVEATETEADEAEEDKVEEWDVVEEVPEVAVVVDGAETVQRWSRGQVVAI